LSFGLRFWVSIYVRGSIHEARVAASSDQVSKFGVEGNEHCPNVAAPEQLGFYPRL